MLSIGTKIVSIAAGALHSLAISAEGELFTWGSGMRGCLGAQIAVLCFRMFTLLSMLVVFALNALVSISCCHLPNIVMQVRSQKMRFTVGHGNSVFGGTQDESAPRLVRKLNGVKVQSAAGGLMNSGAPGASLLVKQWTCKRC